MIFSKILSNRATIAHLLKPQLFPTKEPNQILPADEVWV